MDIEGQDVQKKPSGRTPGNQEVRETFRLRRVLRSVGVYGLELIPYPHLKGGFAALSMSRPVISAEARVPG